MNAPARKTRAGDQFRGMNELSIWLKTGWWVYWHGTPKAPSIILNMPLKIILTGIEHGVIRRCLHARRTTASGYPVPYLPEEF